MKSIKLWRRRSLKKIVVLPPDFTGALLAKTKSSGVVVLALKKGKVEAYETNIDNGDDNPKYYIRKAIEVLEIAHMADLKLYEWENVGDNFDKLMFVYGGELNPRMSCVK